MVAHNRNPDDPLEQIKSAFHADDAARVGELFDRYPALKAKINEPIGPFDSPVIINVQSEPMLDALLAAGADINAKSRWWAGGFGLLHTASPELAAYAIARGAVVDAHAAARLGMLEKLVELISADPQRVHERGGDGQRPLHFASTVEVARYLLDHGAEIDALDVDHESTPAQYRLGDHQDVVRFLISRGCKTDILMAAAVGDLELVRKHLDANPDSIRTRVSDEFFPMIGHRAGGTIYQWTLGFYVSAHQVARKFGHDDVLRLLLERSPAPVKLLAACWLGDESTVQSILQTHPDIAASLSDSDRRQLAFAARNNDTPAVRLFAEAGLPVDVTGQHHATPLHWAAFHGNAEMARALLPFNPPLEATDSDYHATPLGWAIHGSENGWHARTGDYGATVDALLQAGAKLPATIGGTEPVRAALREHGLK